jgi:hypothetical protein
MRDEVKNIIKRIREGDSVNLEGLHFNDREIVDITVALLRPEQRTDSLITNVSYFNDILLQRRLKHEDE